MDTRYRDNGYMAEFTETEYGAYLNIIRKDKVVAQFSIGYFKGGPTSPLQVRVDVAKPIDVDVVHE